MQEQFSRTELIVNQKIEDSDDSSDEEYTPEANLEEMETFRKLCSPYHNFYFKSVHCCHPYWNNFYRLKDNGKHPEFGVLFHFHILQMSRNLIFARLGTKIINAHLNSAHPGARIFSIFGQSKYSRRASAGRKDVREI